MRGMTVVSPGIREAIRAYKADHALDMHRLAAALNITDGQLQRVLATGQARLPLYEQICKIIQHPWRRNYCYMSERPARFNSRY